MFGSTDNCCSSDEREKILTWSKFSALLLLFPAEEVASVAISSASTTFPWHIWIVGINFNHLLVEIPVSERSVCMSLSKSLITCISLSLCALVNGTSYSGLVFIHPTFLVCVSTVLLKDGCISYWYKNCFLMVICWCDWRAPSCKFVDCAL